MKIISCCLDMPASNSARKYFQNRWPERAPCSTPSEAWKDMTSFMIVLQTLSQAHALSVSFMAFVMTDSSDKWVWKKLWRLLSSVVRSGCGGTKALGLCSVSAGSGGKQQHLLSYCLWAHYTEGWFLYSTLLCLHCSLYVCVCVGSP